MIRRSTALVLTTILLPLAARGAPQPNVIILLADDLGYADVGYHGSPDMKTPNIDSISRNGVQFPAGYVSAPVCAPSRAGLLTGLYQNRFGFEDNPGPYKLSAEVKIGIPTAVENLPKRMRTLGYRTGMVGKSHTGNAPEFHPTASGFEEFFGFINGASNYRTDMRFGEEINEANNPILRNRTKVKEHEYLTDAFGREAVAFIDRHKDERFFLYVAFNAIHGPLQARDEDLARFKDIKDKRRQLAVAMNYNLDLNIGRILSALRTHNLENNTLVVFLSDNGGKPDDNSSLNTPLRGWKTQLWDGGIRIPFCLQWPAQVAPGRKIASPVMSIDLLPTILAATGAALPAKIDGTNLLPVVTGKADKLPPRNLYWRFNDSWAVRDADWKLICIGTQGKPQLFRIATDISESKNLVSDEPAIARRLETAYKEWAAQMMPKQWGWNKSFPVNDPTMGGK